MQLTRFAFALLLAGLPLPAVAAPPEIKGEKVRAKFSSIVTAKDLEAYPALPWGLVAIEGRDDVRDRAELAAILRQMEDQKNAGDLSPLEAFCDRHRNSVWTPSVLINLGDVYFTSGYFSRAIDVWKRCLALTAKEKGKRARIVDAAARGKLARMLARVGRREEITALLADVDVTKVSGPARLDLNAARQGVWTMNRQPERAFRCGPEAVASILNAMGKPRPADFEKNTPSPRTGYSLRAVEELAQSEGLDFRAAKRAPGAEILVPCVVNWKLGHFGALVEEDKAAGRYLLIDPTFGSRHWVSAKQIDAEASGYFLVRNGPLPSGWEGVEPTVAEGVHGKGWTGDRNPDNTKNEDLKCQKCTGNTPMAAYQFFSMSASLTVFDTPISYRPAFGPAMDVRVNYNEAEDAPGNLTYTNFGPNWECNFVSFLTAESSEGNPGSRLVINLPGGGAEKFDRVSGQNLYKCPNSSAQVRVLNPTATGGQYVYARILPDGSQTIYGHMISGPSPEKSYFLTSIVDRVGNAVRLFYDPGQPTLLKKVVDATISNPTIDSPGIGFEYGTTGDPGNVYRVTKITDRYSRSATFAYGSGLDGIRRLGSITDPVSIKSEFAYAEDGRMNVLKTPYGNTVFEYSEYVPSSEEFLEHPQDDPDFQRWVQATDPRGDTERVEVFPNPSSSHDGVDQHGSSYYWNKITLKAEGPNPGKAVRYEWLIGSQAAGENNFTSGIPKAIKYPLDSSKLFYLYESAPYVVSPFPQAISRDVTDETGATVEQKTQFEYNSLGNPTKITDPRGRITRITYEENQLDLKVVEQRVEGRFAQLARYEYAAGYPAGCPKIFTDAAGRKWNYTYTDQGQIKTVTSPVPGGVRSGNDDSTTTTYVYYPAANAAYGRLWKIIGDHPHDRTEFTYDEAGRVKTVKTDDSYTVEYDYDAIDRVTKISYPDDTTERFVYHRLDLETHYGRDGVPTTWKYNGLRQPIVRIDGNRDQLRLGWCTCGALSSMTLNGSTTNWHHDIQGRLISKTFPNGLEETYGYYPNNGALKTVKTVRDITKTYRYFVDGSLAGVSYNDGTPAVSYAYDSRFPRLTSASAGGLTNALGYGGEDTRGAMQLTEDDGPFATIAYRYDNRGRLEGRKVDGANNDAGWLFDKMGRIKSLTNNLGAFAIPSFDEPTGRPTLVKYPNGQRTEIDYYGNGEDRRLRRIRNLDSDGSLISKFDYEAYTRDGQIRRIIQTQDDGSRERFAYGYDRINQLKSMKQSDVVSGRVINALQYGYDAAGNRTSERDGTLVLKGGYNRLNQLKTLLGGKADDLVSGATDEPAKLTINGQKVETDAENEFETFVTSSGGTTLLSILTEDYNGNVAASPRQWTFASAGTVGGSFAYNGGNLAGQSYPKPAQYTWDAEDRLKTATVDGHTYEFAYDAFGRRVREKVDGTATRTWVWDGMAIVEERSADGATVRKRFYPQGEQWVGGTKPGKYYYTFDHLGSIREMTDASRNVMVRYAYAPYGEATKTQGDLDASFTYTGHFAHAGSGLLLAPYRAYDPALGRWLSRDPIGEAGGVNLYAYVHNNPVNFIDITGLTDVKGPEGTWKTPSVSDANHVHLYNGVDQGAHMHGPNGAKFFPETGMLLDKNGKWSPASNKFLKQMNKAMRNQLGKGLGAAGVAALLGLVAGEASGSNCEEIANIKQSLADYMSSGDEADATAVAAGINNLFGNEISALSVYKDITNFR